MDAFQPHEREEIWFARLMMILGVKEAVDVLVNLCTILKIRSGLTIVASGTNDQVAIAYLITSAVVSAYLLGGGSLLSRMAYGHRAPRAYVFAEVGLPNWRRCLAIAFRGWGGYHMISAVGSIALAITYTHWPIIDASQSAKRYAAMETAWILEHIGLGFVLLALGGKIAGFFIRTPDLPESPRSPSSTNTPPPPSSTIGF